MQKKYIINPETIEKNPDYLNLLFKHPNNKYRRHLSFNNPYTNMYDLYSNNHPKTIAFAQKQIEKKIRNPEARFSMNISKPDIIPKLHPPVSSVERIWRNKDSSFKSRQRKSRKKMKKSKQKKSRKKMKKSKQKKSRKKSRK